jgi:hypothetical protein
MPTFSLAGSRSGGHLEVGVVLQRLAVVRKDERKLAIVKGRIAPMDRNVVTGAQGIAQRDFMEQRVPLIQVKSGAHVQVPPIVVLSPVVQQGPYNALQTRQSLYYPPRIATAMHSVQIPPVAALRYIPSADLCVYHV